MGIWSTIKKLAGNSDKGCLYVVLTKYGGKGTMPQGEDRYVWSCMIGPKHERRTSIGTKILLQRTYKNITGRRWRLEVNHEARMEQGEMRLVRVRLCKVKDMDQLLKIARSITIDQVDLQFNSAVFTERFMVALDRANAKSRGKIVGGGTTDWKKIRDMAMAYVKLKEAMHRYDGTVPFDMEQTPTFDMIEDRETQE